mgnify:CR=1 FL=1
MTGVYKICDTSELSPAGHPVELAQVELFSLVESQVYKKTSEKEIRRLNLVSLGKVKAGSHVVFTPLPSTTPK